MGDRLTAVEAAAAPSRQLAASRGTVQRDNEV